MAVETAGEAAMGAINRAEEILSRDIVGILEEGADMGDEVETIVREVAMQVRSSQIAPGTPTDSICILQCRAYVFDILIFPALPDVQISIQVLHSYGTCPQNISRCVHAYLGRQFQALYTVK